MRAALIVSFLFVGASAALAQPSPAAPTTTATAPAGDVDAAVVKIDPTPTLLSGKLKKGSASEMFSRLGEQAQAVFTPADEAVFDDPSLQTALFSTDWEKQSFWDALREACDSAGLHVTPDTSTENIGAASLRLLRGPERAPAAVDGLALVRLREVMRDASVSYERHDERKVDRVHLTFNVLLEPKLRGWAWMGAPQIERAVDEHDQALDPIRPAAAGGGSVYQNSRDLAAELRYPPNAGKKLALVEGTIPMQVASEMTTVTFHAPIGRGKEMSADVGPNKLVLQSMTRDESGQFHVKLSLRRSEKETDPGWAVVSDPIFHFRARIALLGPRGPTRQNGGGADANQSETHTDLHFSPRDPDDQPTDLRVLLPARLAPVTVKFQFKDVPMP